MSKNIKLLTDLNTPIIADSSSNDLQLNGKGLKVKTGESTSKQVIETDGTLTQVNALDFTNAEATEDSSEATYTAVVEVTQTDGKIAVKKGKISASGISGVGVTIETKATPTEGYLKTYDIKQGGQSVGVIDIPKDLVVTSGEVVTGTWSGNTFTPSPDGTGKAIKLVIANQTAPIYINVADLVDVYTAAQSAAEVQLAISSTNEISASIVNVAGSKITLTKADSSSTTAQAAFANMNATTTASTATEDTSAIQGISVVTDVTQTDGKVATTTAKADKYGSATKALNDAKSYADGKFKPLQTAVTDPTASGNTTSFIDSISQNANGVITATKKTIPNVVASTSGTGGSAGLMTAAQAETLASLSGDFDDKADKVSGAVSGNFAGLDANGNLTDSGKKATDFATATQGGKADTALQSITKGTDGDYVTTTVGAKGSGTSQSVGVAVTVQSVSAADATHKGLAEASDVKSYVDSAVSGKNVSAEGDDYVTATAANNKVTVASQTSETMTDYTTTTTAKKLATTKGVASFVDQEIGKLDTTNDVTIASASNGVVTLKAGVKEVDGVIAQGTGSDITLAKVATTGAAEDITVDSSSWTVIQAGYLQTALNDIDTALNNSADRVSGATEGNFAGLDDSGNLTDSGKSASDFATSTQGGYADSALQNVTKGTESNYATVTIGTKTGNNGAKTQTIGVSNTIQAVASADASHMGLAEASDVKTYVDAKVYVDAQGAHIAFGNGYTLDITTEGAISATVPTA